VDNFNRGWTLTCFGTAIGAGILFLPICTGLCSIWSILFLTFILFPITYISHRGITRIVASCPKKTDIVGAVEYDLGHTAGFVVSVLYFLSIISICVGYATGLTNMIDALLTNLNIAFLPRPLLTLIILGVITSVMMFSERVMVVAASALTFPLIILLFAISVYMIPQWNFSSFHKATTLIDFIKDILFVLPILIFAMNFSPVCSSLGSFCRKKFSNTQEAVKNSDHIVKWTSILLLTFLMFFNFYIFFSTTPEVIFDAKAKNIDILTAIAIAYKTPEFLYILPLVAFLAIITSYFGHFEGTREGLIGIIVQITTWNRSDLKNRINSKKLKLLSTVLLVTLLWVLAVYNLSVLSIIEAVSSPIVAMYAYLMPVVLMKKVPRLRIYQSKISAFVFTIGIITIIGYCLRQIM
jgi:serine transporter